jgi:hypothetical protein
VKRLAAILVVVAAAGAVVAACSDTTATGVDSQDLNRPIDIAFACYGGLRLLGQGSDVVSGNSAQPIESCNTQSTVGSNGEKIRPAGQEPTSKDPLEAATWYAFILQSEPGTVGIAKFPTQPTSSFAGGEVEMLDADDLTPGENGISVGEDPVAIGTDMVGCKEVIANAGSCDLSVLDINSALSNGHSATVDRLAVTNASGTPLRARPAAMAMQPAGGTIGVACGATATGVAYIAYPSCHLVAAVDTATGVIKDGLQWDASGIPAPIDPATIACPDECSGDAPTPGVRPMALDLERDDRVGREVLVIGADNSSSLTVVDLDVTTSLIGANAPQRYALEQTIPNLGITSVAVSPQIGMGGASGINDDSSIGGQMQFVYAVATDNTIHVVEIASIGKECDTQVDPRYLHDTTNVRQLSCLPVGDPATPPRRPGARGPGIEMVADAIPTSVTIMKVSDPGVNSRHFNTDLTGQPDPKQLIGYFAFATSANGATYVINVDDDDQADNVQPATTTTNPLMTQIPFDIAHQVRDAIPNRGLLATESLTVPDPLPDQPDHTKVITVPVCSNLGPDPDSTAGASGGARATDDPTRTLPSGSIAGEKVVALPSIRQVLCTSDPMSSDNPKMRPVTQNTFSAPIDVRDATFPDIRALRADETWTFTWEGSLSQDTVTSAVDGPSVRESQMFIDALGAHLVDQSKPFCDAGVEPYDIVQLRGCDPSLGDADCALGYTCFTHPQSKVAGLGACMLKDEADRLANTCKSFLTSLRRYTVAKSTSGQLDLVPRKHVLRTTPLDGCNDDAQCQQLADYALTLASSADPRTDSTPNDTHQWACQADPLRAPEPGTGKRCVETCTQDSDCDDGTVCDNGTCMEGVIPPQACVNAVQRYELRAGEAFTVVGTTSGYVHPIIADPSGTCVRDPNASPDQIGRIPLVAPACDPTADPRTGALPGGGFDANPCMETVDETEYEPTYPNANSCAQGTPNLVTQPRDAIRFRNRGMQLDIVDPTYPGDQNCIGDRGRGLVNVPTVSPGVQFSFRQTAGFFPMVLPVAPSYPVKVIKGPTESVWVIDEGDFLSTSITTFSTRGKVFRIEAQNQAAVSTLE